MRLLLSTFFLIIIFALSSIGSDSMASVPSSTASAAHEQQTSSKTTEHVESEVIPIKNDNKGELWLLIITFFAAIFSGFSAFAVFQSNKLSKAWEKPILGIRLSEKKFEFNEEGFANTPVKFKIINMGRSPAQIIEIHRQWESRTNGEFPQPIDPNDAVNKKIARKKEYVRYVSGQSETEQIWTNESLLTGFEQGSKKRLFFHGYIRYKDMLDKEYISGFCYFIDPEEESTFSSVWPNQDYEKYTYYRAL